MIVAEGAVPMSATIIGTAASMGPQLDSCGRAISKTGAIDAAMLQWGRNLIVAEG